MSTYIQVLFNLEQKSWKVAVSSPFLKKSSNCQGKMEHSYTNTFYDSLLQFGTQIKYANCMLLLCHVRVSKWIYTP